MNLRSPEAVRGFLALCLDPGHGIKRTPAEVAKAVREVPGPPRDALERFAPHLADLREACDSLDEHAQDAHQIYVEALDAWIRNEPRPLTETPPAAPDQGRRDRYAEALYNTLEMTPQQHPWATLSPFRRAVWYARADAAITVADAEADELENITAPERVDRLRTEFFECASVESIQVQQRRATRQRGRWQSRLDRMDTLLNIRREQIEAGVWPEPADTPAVTESGEQDHCPQNRVGNFIRLTDPVQLGPHFYQENELGLRCVYCDVPCHWGGEPLVAPTVRPYVHNARSVNRTAKHAIHPTDPRRTLCPSSFVATAPMPPEEAVRLPLCGGCRRALTGETD